MSTIGVETLSEESPVIANLCADPRLAGFLAEVLGEDTGLVEDPIERHVLNCLHEPGDTHGAHFDDHTVALVLFLEPPLPGVEGFSSTCLALGALLNSARRHASGGAPG